MDPVDIADPHQVSGPDLRQPFFPDGALRGVPSVYDGRNNPHPEMSGMAKRWSEFRGKANADRILQFMESLPSRRSICIELRSALANYPASGIRTYFPWKKGLPLPQASASNPQAVPNTPEMEASIRLNSESPSSSMEFTATVLAHLTAQKLKAAIDLTAFAPDSVKKILSQGLKAPNP